MSLSENLRKAYERWEELYKNGGSDPFFSDGQNLELVKNHIIYYKKECEKTLNGEDYPQEYYRKLPPDVKSDYMAKAEEIKLNAIKAANILSTDANYLRIIGLGQLLTDKEKETTLFSAGIGYVTNLQIAIRENDLVTQRRYQDTGRYMDALADIRKNIEKVLRDRNIAVA